MELNLKIKWVSSRTVRVVFLTAPFKARMMERMAVHFSKQIDYRILVPSYPYKTESKPSSRFDRIGIQLFGEDSTRRAVLDFKPELVYTDTTLHAATMKLFALSVGKSIPFVTHLRGNWWQEYYAWFRYAPWRKRVLGTQQYFYNWFSLITSVKITPICRWLEKVVKCHIPFKPTQVVYQGIDPLEFSETSEKYGFNRPAVAIIQNHTVLPKVAGLLKFSRVIKGLPSVQFYITEGEAYDQSYVLDVKQAMAGLENVHFVKGINNPSAVRKMLSSTDCYVLPTELDCCPTTVLEASLMRKPVIASRVGGVPETVCEGTTGWTIPNDDVSQWMMRIEEVVSDHRLRASMGSAGREWVVNNFAWSKIASEVENLIISLVPN